MAAFPAAEQESSPPPNAADADEFRLTPQEPVPVPGKLEFPNVSPLSGFSDGSPRPAAYSQLRLAIAA